MTRCISATITVSAYQPGQVETDPGTASSTPQSLPWQSSTAVAKPQIQHKLIKSLSHVAGWVCLEPHSLLRSINHVSMDRHIPIHCVPRQSKLFHVSPTPSGRGACGHKYGKVLMPIRLHADTTRVFSSAG